MPQAGLAPKPTAGVHALHNTVTGCFSAGGSNSMAGGSQDLLQPNNLALSWCKYSIPHPKFFLPQLLPAPLGSQSISPPQHTPFSLACTTRIGEAVKWDHRPACGLLRFSAAG